MLKDPARITCCVALMSITMTIVAGPAFAQSEPAQPVSLQIEVQSLKAENAVIRERLRKMEEQPKALLDQVDRLQRRLDGATTDGAERGDQSQLADAGSDVANAANAPATSAGNTTQQPSVEKPEKDDRY